MWRAGRLNIHSARHMLLLLHLSASGIPVAAACAEAAIRTDKSLINRHKQQSDPPQPNGTDTQRHSFSGSARGPALNQVLKRGTMNHNANLSKRRTSCASFGLGFTLSLSLAGLLLINASKPKCPQSLSDSAQIFHIRTLCDLLSGW